MKTKKIRIYIGPIEIAGYYSNLARGFRALGYECDFITFYSHASLYGGETTKPLIMRFASWLSKFRDKSQRHWVIHTILTIPIEVFRHIWALYAIFKYDVFVFAFGSSLTRGNKDLILLRWLNKIVISNLGHGSDARPPYIDGSYQLEGGEGPSVRQIYSASIKLKDRQERHEKYATIVIGAPNSTSHFSRRTRLLNAFAMGVPIDLSYVNPLNFPNGNVSMRITPQKVRILHCPSHHEAKGSRQIKVAIDNLKTRGHDIDFVLIHGKPFSEVVNEIQKCDFVVDQLYSDTPMAGFATEAAWFGKPAVVGGYDLENLRAFIPEGMWPPSKICHPDDIELAIEDLIQDKLERDRLGRESKVFVHEKWSANEIAGRYIRLIHGDIPDEWWFNPKDVVYVYGCGQSVFRTKDNIRKLVKQYGVKSLLLSDRPDLEKAFLQLADLNESDAKNAPCVS